MVAKAKGIKGFESYGGGLDTVWTASGQIHCNSNYAKRRKRKTLCPAT